MSDILNIHEQVAEIALDNVRGQDFEEFFKSFYTGLLGPSFIPVGGVHDGGADGLIVDTLSGDGVLEGTRVGRFFQATIQENHRTKIKHTVARLREVGRNPKEVIYGHLYKYPLT